jgi:hypothetical protein
LVITELLYLITHSQFCIICYLKACRSNPGYHKITCFVWIVTVSPDTFVTTSYFLIGRHSIDKSNWPSQHQLIILAITASMDHPGHHSINGSSWPPQHQWIILAITASMDHPGHHSIN